MTQDEKQLLLKVLCAMLPYNVKVDITYSKEHGSSDRLRICSEGCLMLNTDVLGLYIEDEIYLKPYLRPMSSMTEEERKEYHSLCYEEEREQIEYGEWITRVYYHDTIESIDWLNKHHFDYRGLIPMGLSIEAPSETWLI